MKGFVSKFLFRFLLTCTLTQLQSISFAQDSSRLRISLLTCTPGEDLYAIFGHSALRVIDSNNINNRFFDVVYNYGTFDFYDENFYLKFIRGKLLYSVSDEIFNDFKTAYQLENRGITEQVLDLSAEEKINTKKLLIENLREENRYYKYDFFLDNCTTRLRDLILKIKKPAVLLPAVMPANTRFRQAIHQYLDSGKQYWSKLGIDILLGAKTDAVMTTAQQQFLPDNLMLALDKSEPSIVITSTNLYQLSTNNNKAGWFTPMLFFSSLLIFFLLLSLSKNKYLQMLLKGLDGFLFFATGLLGIVLIFMWVGTDHSMTKDNYNLWWALPFHIIMAFLINSNKTFVKKYFLFTAISLLLLLLAWAFLPQQLNIALIPFVLLLAFRAGVKGVRV
ncbi:DUF4105 domain-containing protein [soil metagenome]